MKSEKMPIAKHDDRKHQRARLDEEVGDPPTISITAPMKSPFAERRQIALDHGGGEGHAEEHRAGAAECQHDELAAIGKAEYRTDQARQHEAHEEREASIHGQRRRGSVHLRHRNA